MLLLIRLVLICTEILIVIIIITTVIIIDKPPNIYSIRDTVKSMVGQKPHMLIATLSRQIANYD